MAVRARPMTLRAATGAHEATIDPFCRPVGGHQEPTLSRIPLIDPDCMTAEQREQFDRFPSNLTRALLLTEQRLSTALPNVANALRTSDLDPKIREGAILRVAALMACPYERMQHLAQAQKAGWDDAGIEAIECGDAAALPDTFRPVLAFVDACVASPRMPDPVFDAARAVLPDRDLATLILLVGHYMTVARFIETLQVELDAEPDDWTTEH